MAVVPKPVAEFEIRRLLIMRALTEWVALTFFAIASWGAPSGGGPRFIGQWGVLTEDELSDQFHGSLPAVTAGGHLC